MKAIVEAMRGARHFGILIGVVLVSALGLALLGASGGRQPAGTEIEVRLERLLGAIDGVGDVDVMVTTDDEGRPVGAAVVVGGRLDVRATLEIQSAVRALLDIDTNRIRVIGKGGSQG